MDQLLVGAGKLCVVLEQLEPLAQEVLEQVIERPIFTVMQYPLVITGGVLLLLSFWRIDWLMSAAMGSLLWLLPNAYFTHYAFRYRGARNAPWIARSFYWGQSGKMLLTLVGFAVVFRMVKPLSLPVLFGMYGLLSVVHIWVARRIEQKITQQNIRQNANQSHQ